MQVEEKLCEYCDEPVDEADKSRPFIIGLDGHVAHADCLTKWRDDNRPEEDVA